MALILTPLHKALSSLKLAVEQPKNEFTRDAVIQRFEYSFELCWKMLKRHLKTSEGVEEYNIKNLFREAAKRGYLADFSPWLRYHEARNLTSHTYNESQAEETYRVAVDFLPDAEKLLQKLENANDTTTQLV